MTIKHLRSSTLDKRPQPSGMADGQLALNTASGSPGLFFKNAGGSLVKIGPVHVGSTAPNASPASGGTSGNSVGEQWLDTSGGSYLFKIWDGAAWRSETGEFVNASGDTMTGPLILGPSASLIFEGSTDDGFETTLTVVDPTGDRTITLPNVDGTVITTGDTGTVTSTMIANGTIVNADINASAAIDYSKLAALTSGSIIIGNASNVATGTAVTGDVTISNSGVTAISNGVIVNADINANAAIDYSKLATLTSGNIVLGNSSNVATSTTVTGDVTISNTGVTAISSGVIVNADINASAAIAYSKLASLTSGNILIGSAGNVATSTAVTGDVTISNAGVTAISSGVIVNADINASAAINLSKLATGALPVSITVTSGNVADSSILTSGNIGVTVQAYDADTAKLDNVQTFTALQTFGSGITLSNSSIGAIKTATFNSQATLASTSGSIAIDWSAAQNYFQTEPTGTITYTFTAPPGPCHLQLLINSDGTSTAQTINWPGSVTFLGSTWSGANNKKSVINLWYDGTNYFAIGTNQP